MKWPVCRRGLGTALVFVAAFVMTLGGCAATPPAPPVPPHAASTASATMPMPTPEDVDHIGLGDLWQSVWGHWQVLQRAQPVETWLADPTLKPALRERLTLAKQARDYATQALALPDNASYRRYADVGRPAVVWNVVAAPELSLTLKTWCFPVVGCVGYRGYYDRAQAEAAAQVLRQQGWEAYVYGVPAYSTLGKLPNWSYFADPLLSTFVFQHEIDLVRLIFHELAHQVAFAPGDTTFNESFATAVERLGGQQWLQAQGRAEDLLQAERLDARRTAFRELTLRYRGQLDTLFRSPVSDADKRAGKARLLAAMRQEYQQLRDGAWGGDKGYDPWFEQVNTARLGVLSAYNAQVPAFERLFERSGREWPRFYAEVKRLAGLDRAAREAALTALQQEAVVKPKP